MFWIGIVMVVIGGALAILGIGLMFSLIDFD